MIKGDTRPRVLVPVTHGTEDMEAVITIDILRRAQWEVVVTGLEAGVLTAAGGIHLMPDKVWDEIDPDLFTILMIPGGAHGVERFLHFPPLLDTIRNFHHAGKWIGAVCAAPLVLQAAGILAGRKVTCHPAVASRLTVTPRLDQKTVLDGRLLTSQGAGTTLEFALTMVKSVEGAEKARTIAEAIVFAG